MKKKITSYITNFDPLDAGLVGFFSALIAAAWIRGYKSGSPLSNAEVASHLADSGPYWPFVMIVISWVVMGASIVTWFQHEYRLDRG